MIVVIGAGITGMTAAHFLRRDYLILEKESLPGGLSGEYEAAFGSFPCGGHYFHFQNKATVLDFLQGFMPFREFHRDSRVLLAGRFIPFPIQYHLAFLPRRERWVIGNQMLARAESRGSQETTAGGSLEEFLLAHFGERLVQIFFAPFLEKFYGCSPAGLLANMDKGSIPVPTPSDVRSGLAGRRFSQVGYNARFHYPRSLSLQDFIARFAAPLRSRLRLNCGVIRVDLEKRTVHTKEGSFPYRFLVNTAPLNQFLALCGRPADGLRHISTLVVNGVLRRRRRRFNWLYLPERQFPFYRVGYYPASGYVPFYLEKSLPHPAMPGRAEVEAGAMKTLLATGMISAAHEVECFDHRLIPVSYVLFDRRWPLTVPALLEELRRQDVLSIGRYGSWNYTSMTDDILSAKAAAERLNFL